MVVPLTPGDAREDHAQTTAAAVAVSYAQAELVLIATVAALARKVASGAMPLGVAQRRLARSTGAVFAGIKPSVQRAVSDGMAGAASGARGAAVAIVGEAAAQIAPTSAEQLAEALNDAARTAATSLRDVLTAAATANTPDSAAVLSPYRQAVDNAIGSTRGGMPGTSLSLSRIQAAQKALDDLGQRGITAFVDRSGRRWDLASYVEMATRTAVSNSWDDMQTAALVRSGLDLVEVYTHSTEGSCPQCRPWLGQILSLTGATPGHPTLAQAKATGFRHPNCRCSWSGVGAGVAPEVTNPVALNQAAAVYRASQRQRALERRVRDAGRRAHAAITPQARTTARRDLAAARAVSEAHRRRTGLRMTQVGVKRREHPLAAR